MSCRRSSFDKCSANQESPISVTGDGGGKPLCRCSVNVLESDTEEVILPALAEGDPIILDSCDMIEECSKFCADVVSVMLDLAATSMPRVMYILREDVRGSFGPKKFALRML